MIFIRAASAVAPGVASSARQTSASAPQAGRITYTEETLPNGLHVVYSEDHPAPVVAVDIWYNVGSKMEQPGRTGGAVCAAVTTGPAERSQAEDRNCRSRGSLVCFRCRGNIIRSRFFGGFG